MTTDRHCRDCRVNTSDIYEYYMVHDEVWQAAGADTEFGWGMLCIGCLEVRLGRTLTPADFTDCWVNHPQGWRKSQRLMSRMAETSL